MGGRRDGRVRLRERRYLEDGWIGGEHQRDRVKGGRSRESEVWERRWLSCLFEDKSERQCSEEVWIHKRTHEQMCVCTHA